MGERTLRGTLLVLSALHALVFLAATIAAAFVLPAATDLISYPHGLQDRDDILAIVFGEAILATPLLCGLTSGTLAAAGVWAARRVRRTGRGVAGRLVLGVSGVVVAVYLVLGAGLLWLDSQKSGDPRVVSDPRCAKSCDIILRCEKGPFGTSEDLCARDCTKALKSPADRGLYPCAMHARDCPAVDACFK